MTEPKTVFCYGGEAIELKPCPFCGAIMNLSKGGELVSWHDSDCFFVLLGDEEVNLTDEQINDLFVKAWNRRANDDNH